MARRPGDHIKGQAITAGLSASRTEGILRRRQVAIYRLQRMTIAEIAAACGASPRTIARDIKAIEALAKAETLKDEAARKAEHRERIYAGIGALIEDVINGRSMDAHARYQKYLDQLAALDGLNDPEKQAVSHTGLSFIELLKARGAANGA